MISRADLIDVREERSVSLSQFECRTNGNTLKFEGYASIFDKPYEVHGGPSVGGWDETVNRSAFKRTLADKPDVVLLLEHGGLPLARTRNMRGDAPTLKLGTDTTGLHTASDLDMRDPDVRSIAVKYDRGDLGEMSFAFRVKQNTWSDDETQRSLDEVSLHKGDVSIVTFGANPHTSSTLRSAIQMLARGEIREEQLAEIRSMSVDVDRAMAALRAARDDKPYGDVKYADPKNGKYPIDTKEHVKAAWSYINMPKNQGDYSASELADIKGRIKSAAKKFGVEISDDGQNSSWFDGELAQVEAITGGGGSGGEGRVDASLWGGQTPSKITPPDPIAETNAFAQKAHNLTVDHGANCNAMGGTRALSPTSDLSPEVQNEDWFEGGYQGPRDSLEQAVHDLVHDQANPNEGHPSLVQDIGEETSPYRNLSVHDAVAATLKPGNLTLRDAVRMCRPEDSPEPLSVEEAMRLAS